MRSPQGLSTEARLAERRQLLAGVGRASSTPSAGPCCHPVDREGCLAGVFVGLPRSSPGDKDLLASSLLEKWAWGHWQGSREGRKEMSVNELSPTAGPPGGSIERVTGRPLEGQGPRYVSKNSHLSLAESPSSRLQLPNLPQRALACSQSPGAVLGRALHGPQWVSAAARALQVGTPCSA